MTRRKKLWIAVGCGLLVLAAFFVLRQPGPEKPPIEIPAEWKLTGYDPPLTTLELAAEFRHGGRLAMTVATWDYETTGSYLTVAKQVESLLKGKGTWRRRDDHEWVDLYEPGKNGRTISVYKDYFDSNECHVEIIGRLQRAGGVEKTLALFPIDNYKRRPAP